MAGERADVGEHQHGGVLLQDRINVGGQVGVLGGDQLGIRGERLLDVVEGGEQRLGLLLAFT